MAAQMPTLEGVVLRIQGRVFPRRMRPAEFFTDFDNLRKYECTEGQFRRGMNQLMPQLSLLELEVLVDS